MVIGFVSRLALFIIIFNVFLSLSMEALGLPSSPWSGASPPNVEDVEKELNETSTYSQLQPLLYFTWLTTIKMWNIFSSIIKGIFMTGTLIRSIIPLIPVEIEVAINIIVSAVVIFALVEFIRGIRL